MNNLLEKVGIIMKTGHHLKSVNILKAICVFFIFFTHTNVAATQSFFVGRNPILVENRSQLKKAIALGVEFRFQFYERENDLKVSIRNPVEVEKVKLLLGDHSFISTKNLRKKDYGSPQIVEVRILGPVESSEAGLSRNQHTFWINAEAMDEDIYELINSVIGKGVIGERGQSRMALS